MIVMPLSFSVLFIMEFSMKGFAAVAGKMMFVFEFFAKIGGQDAMGVDLFSAGK